MVLSTCCGRKRKRHFRRQEGLGKGGEKTSWCWAKGMEEEDEGSFLHLLGESIFAFTCSSK